MSYELPPSNIAGARRRQPMPAAEPGLFVDYADVLEQAKLNERESLLRELYREISGVSTRSETSYSYRTEARGADAVKTEILRIIERKQS